MGNSPAKTTGTGVSPMETDETGTTKPKTNFEKHWKKAAIGGSVAGGTALSALAASMSYNQWKKLHKEAEHISKKPNVTKYNQHTPNPKRKQNKKKNK